MTERHTDSLDELLRENDRRNAELSRTFNPVTGEGSILQRQRVTIDDFVLPVQHVPLSMLDVPLFSKIAERHSIRKFVTDTLRPSDTDERDTLVRLVAEQLERLRQRHDFAYWCAVYSTIQNKEGGDYVTLLMNHAQRRLAAEYERQRLNNSPIRLVLLKARQWGGSTLTQLYMAWLQLVILPGLNSIIVAQVLAASTRIKAMFNRLLTDYPTQLLYPIGATFDEKKPKFASLLGSHVEHTIPQRKCTVTIGSMEKPDSVRSGAYALAHLSEVAMWKETDGKKPQDVIRSATGGVLYKPLTMIVYESTANGMNFFHDEWMAASAGASQFTPFFVPWHEIEQYSITDADTRALAQSLLDRRDARAADNDREEPGQYLWWLWQRGATLQHIAWYIQERKKYNNHADMAAEYPTDDLEAFKHSGNTVFAKEYIDKLYPLCKPPAYTGEIVGAATNGPDSLNATRFSQSSNGRLKVWELPEPDTDDEVITNRYITVADVGRGLTDKADYSVIVTLDRLSLMDNDGKPVVVAQWAGHTDMDILAWTAARQAKFYNNSLLVIESNTLETNGGVSPTLADANNFVLELIAEYYPNLYRRAPSAEQVKKGEPGRYGFHTNPRTKRDIIDLLVAVVREQAYIERDKATLDELYIYIITPKGKLTAPPGKHDDRLMTRAIALWVSDREMPRPAIVRRDDYARFMQRPLSEASI